MQKFGYIAKEGEDYFRFPEQVRRPRFEGVKGDLPGPGEYEADIKPKIKGGIKYTSKKTTKYSPET